MGGASLSRRGGRVCSVESQVTGLEDELADLTQRFAALDHTWDEERAALEAGMA